MSNTAADRHRRRSRPIGRRWRRYRRAASAGALVAVLLVAGCGWFDRDGAEDVDASPAGYSDRSVVDFLPAGVTVDPSRADPSRAEDLSTADGSDYRVRAWNAFTGDWGAGTTWPGTLRLNLPDPGDPVTEHPVTSTGSMALPQPAVHVVTVDGGTAKVLTDRSGRQIGALTAGPGRYGSVLDLDGDGVVDVIDALTLRPPGRMVALNEVGETYQAELAGGRARCVGAGPDGWDPRVRLVLDCAGGETSATGRPSIVTVGLGQPGTDAVEVVVTAREAADAVAGMGGAPSAEDIADATRFAEDLERYGGAVVAGAVLNDMLSDSMPSWLPEVLGWVGDQSGAAVDDGAAGRLLSRSTDDLLDLARIQILLLGGDPATDPPADGSDTDTAAGGCELRDAQTGTCYDGQDGAGLSWGDPHLRTFDGLDYDFQAVGEFVLTRFTDDDTEVQVRYQPYRDSDRLSTTSAVAVRLPDGAVQVAHDGAGADSVRVTVAGTPLGPGDRRLLGTGQVTRAGRTVQVGLPGGGQVFVLARAALLDVTVLPASRPVTGLLGDADDDPADDLRTADGRVLDPAALSATDLYGEFADTWRVDAATSVLPYPAGTGTDDVTDRAFPAEPAALAGLPARQRAAATALCRHAGVTDAALLAGCVLDVAATGDGGFVASAAGAQRAVGLDADTDGQLEIDDRWYPVRGWADGVQTAAAVAAGVVDKDPANVLGPRDVRNLHLGEGDTKCEFPLVVRMAGTPLRDGPGADLGVVQIGAGDARYQVWVAVTGSTRWRWVGAGDGPAVFDLADVLDTGEQADRVRLCDPPAEVDGDRRDRFPLGPAIDAVAALGISDAVAVAR